MATGVPKEIVLKKQGTARLMKVAVPCQRELGDIIDLPPPEPWFARYGPAYLLKQWRLFLPPGGP